MANDKKLDTKKEIHKKRVNLYVERYDKIDNNIDKIYLYVWIQCTSSLQQSIVERSEFKENMVNSDVILILKELKLATSDIDTNTNKYENIIEALLTLFNTRQGNTESNNGYLKRFKSNV